MRVFLQSGRLEGFILHTCLRCSSPSRWFITECLWLKRENPFDLKKAGDQTIDTSLWPQEEIDSPKKAQDLGNAPPSQISFHNQVTVNTEVIYSMPLRSTYKDEKDVAITAANRRSIAKLTPQPTKVIIGTTINIFGTSRKTSLGNLRESSTRRDMTETRRKGSHGGPTSPRTRGVQRCNKQVFSTSQKEEVI